MVPTTGASRTAVNLISRCARRARSTMKFELKLSKKVGIKSSKFIIQHAVKTSLIPIISHATREKTLAYIP